MELMSQEQWRRLDVLRRIEAGGLTRAEAARVLGLSKRQVRRLFGA
jgi:AraC-like DNA-binding protein